MNYYLVFQNKSYKEESNGGYIWAPQKNKKGGGEFHWHNVAEVKKGDIILHCFNQRIVAISEAVQNGHEEKRPEQLKERGDWKKEGWMAEVEYKELDTPFIIPEHREKILKLKADWHAPFNKNGKGNQGYLYEINRELYEYVFEEMLKVKQVERMKLYIEKILNSDNLKKFPRE